MSKACGGQLTVNRVRPPPTHIAFTYEAASIVQSASQQVFCVQPVFTVWCFFLVLPRYEPSWKCSTFPCANSLVKTLTHRDWLAAQDGAALSWNSYDSLSGH